MKNIWIELVGNDIHVPEHNDAALACFVKTAELLRPDGITLNGDIMDCGLWSRHDIDKKPKCNWTDSQFYEKSRRDFDAMTSFLNQLDSCGAKRKRWQLGNHEEWLEDFIRQSPSTRRKFFGLEERLHLKRRRWQLSPYNKPLYVGKLAIIHGLFTGQHHAAKTVNSMAGSVLYGHSHDIQAYSKHTLEHTTHMGWCNGCLCDLNPEYLKNKGQNWSHGFSVVYAWPNGSFQVDQIRIQNGRCIVHGKEIKGV